MSYPPEHSDMEYDARVEERDEARELLNDCEEDRGIQTVLFGEREAEREETVRRLRGVVRAQARFLRWVADNYKGVDLDIVRARANELDALAARGEAS